MSTVTVNKQHTVDGALTDATTFTLGVVRTDTGATVVAAGTAMTRTATGTYSYSWTEPTSGLTYTINYVLVYDGETTAWEESVVGSALDSVSMPALTGDTLVDTLNSLMIERLNVSRDGPKPSYMLHGHRVDWTQYLEYTG
jgi:hypothetical protein